MGLCFMRNENPIIDVRVFLSPGFEYVTQPPEPRLLRCRISEIFVPLKKKKASPRVGNLTSPPISLPPDRSAGRAVAPIRPRVKWKVK